MCSDLRYTWNPEKLLHADGGNGGEIQAFKSQTHENMKPFLGMTGPEWSRMSKKNRKAWLKHAKALQRKAKGAKGKKHT